VRLEAPDVPGYAAVIQPEGDAWAIRALANDSSVQVNGEAVADRRLLAHGDRIAIRDFTIEAHSDVGARPSVGSMTRFVRFQLPPGSQVKKEDEPLTLRQVDVQHGGGVNVELGRCETPEQLMDVALRCLISTFNAHRVWCGLRRVNYGPMEYVEGRLVTGQTADLPMSGENLKPRVLDRAQYVRIPELSETERTTILSGPLQGPDGTLGMIYLDASGPDRRYGEEDFDRFIYLMTIFASQLDAIFKQVAKQRAETMSGEVTVTHFIQNRLTPRKLPQWDGQVQFGAFREPGRQRSSDVYDIVRLGNKMAGFMLAHARGEGALPAMHIAQTQAAFRTAAMHLDAPHIFIRMVNTLIFDGQGEHGIDCIMGVIDPASGKMQYSYAGDIGAYVISARGEERSLVAAGLPPVGRQRDHAYASLMSELEEGETLALFTDGVVSASNGKGENFGRERFVNILCDGFGQLASAMLKEMLSDLKSYTEGGSQPDDITVILAHRPVV
jgi:serine phosphatase RsbU (regulator of sigma subunit)